MELQLAEVDLSGIDDTTTCQVCAKLLALYKMPFEVNAEVKLGKVSDVLASECPHANWVRNVKYMYGPVPRYGRRELTAWRHENNTAIFLGVSYRSRTASTWSTTQPFELVSRDSQPGNLGRSRILDPEWVDLDVVRTWYSRCVKEHRLKCEQPAWIKGVEPAKPDWLIDIVQGCIVPYSSETKKYLSLSYTWGQTPNLRATTHIFDELRKPGALDPGRGFASMIPETIRNALGITKCLGERYLWVDSLCIVQDDETALYRSLKNMHMIFANSLLCVIAKAGHDAEFGLRGIKGVSAPRCSDQLIIDLAEGERLTGRLTGPGSCYNEPSPSIPGRSYSERAWTFQEFMFAKRRLIFDDGPIRWNCNCAGWHEELKSHAVADIYGAVAPELWYAARWMKTRIPNLSDLTDVVREFNQKVLTYPEDVLPAFSGIQSMLHRIYPGGLIFGHPEFFFDISLAWHNVYDVTRRRPSSNFKGDPSKNGLPSWSWMGWHGNTCFPWDLEFHTSNGDKYGFLAPVTTWFTMASPLSLPRRRIESQWFDYKKSAQGGSGRLLEGWNRGEYEPPKWLKRRDKFRVPHLPKDLPQFCYTHSSNPERKFWYPVPILKFDETPELNKQTQYLYCLTTRTFLFVGHGLVHMPYKENVRIENRQGDLAGVLFLHREEDRRLFTANPQPLRIELVAIAKGWTETLQGDPPSESKSQGSHDLETVAAESAAHDREHIEASDRTSIDGDKPVLSSNNKGLGSSKEAGEEGSAEGISKTGQHSGADAGSKKATEPPDAEDSDREDSGSDGSWGAHLDSDDERPEYWKENKEDCYFVLWIKWDNGVAYRQAAGRVLASMWEKYREEDPVELVLG
ncbi:uncharacterized protein BP5553_06610 [Venustampulla echinocandica]|uniref:Heterokaryon incompatibility domain-containing protein n=1 Tax=Venustampulla echinocandica TaxID=2656787 RepID=A0A370TKE4_9HELO|nr:uncharacterized protein BP5553_06610 [Venustampulla echinocandica]RDL35998.1 hypothetical protein BP5553_06610 [Venustampulla echinocandica]